MILDHGIKRGMRPGPTWWGTDPSGSVPRDRQPSATTRTTLRGGAAQKTLPSHRPESTRNSASMQKSSHSSVQEQNPLLARPKS